LFGVCFIQNSSVFCNVRSEKIVNIRLRKLTNRLRCGAEFLAVFLAVYFAGGPCKARDMIGVVDLNNHAVIPCVYKSVSYAGCGFYLCQGFEAGPGAKVESFSFVPLGSLPPRVKEEADRRGFGRQKILVDRNGNKQKLRLPKDAALMDVFIPEKTKRAYLLNSTQCTAAKGLPNDALISVIGSAGIGVCDLQGNYLVQPIYPVLVLGSAVSGVITAFEWDEGKNQLIQVNVPLKIRMPDTEVKEQIRSTELPKSVQKAYDGMTVYRSPEGLYGYMDEQGKIAIPAKYYSAGHFSGGIAAVRLNPWNGPEKGRHCFIDKTGKMVSPFFWRIWGFYGEYALVAEKGEESEGKSNYRKDLYGLIDRNYKYFLPLAPNPIRYLPEGYWVIGNGSDVSIVLDRQGKEVFRTPERAHLFSENSESYVFVTSGAGQRKLLYYDKSWKPIKEVVGEPAQYGPIPTIITIRGTGYDALRAVVDGKGEFLIGPENAEFKSAEPDRFVKTVFGTKFVKEDWDIPNRNRRREFQLFVEEYNLVGMKRSEVERLLGPGSKSKPGVNTFYPIAGFGAECGNAYESVEIEYVDDLVSRWRYSSIGSANKWKD